MAQRKKINQRGTFFGNQLIEDIYWNMTNSKFANIDVNCSY